MISGSISIKGQVPPLLNEVLATSNFFERSRGLLFRSPLLIDSGLLIMHCNSIHTVLMTYPIDVIYLSNDMRITKLVKSIKPYRTSIDLSARHVLEVMVGSIDRSELRVDDQLAWVKKC